MRAPRKIVLGMMVVALLLGGVRLTTSGSSLGLSHASAGPRVTVRSVSGASIEFVTQNGEVVDGAPPDKRRLPLLVLHRNGILTAPDERTVVVEVRGVTAPPGGMTVTLEVSTQHVDPDAAPDSGDTMRVWREIRRIPAPNAATWGSEAMVFSHTFTETVASDNRAVPTPTDYFRCRITVAEAAGSAPAREFASDLAFLMENRWITPLPEVREESEGAAPDELVVYYCDMFGFRRSAYDNSSRILRRDIPEFVQGELAPRMIEAFRVETDVWGFAWTDAWNSFRGGEDAERLSVALSDGQTWYHGWAPDRAHSEISIAVAGGGNAPYDSLADGMMSIFYHELFHNLQRGISQGNGGYGDVDGKADAWQFFSEGTAVLASSVGQPQIEFSRTAEKREYMWNANEYLRLTAGLNASYTEMNVYRAAVYWRFLYEQCDGMKDGVEDPAAGMQVIRRALTTLYTSDIVDIDTSADLVGHLPAIVDQALAGSSCPFQTYEDSLLHLARAIYALRLEGGRCTQPGQPEDCGFYDPNGLYRDPPVSTVFYSGEEQRYLGDLGSSFSFDFIEIQLDAVDGQSLTVECHGAPDAEAEFTVQAWSLLDRGSSGRPRPILEQAGGPEVLGTICGGGRLVTIIPAIQLTEIDRIALIITRVDAHEKADPVGAYTIRLAPG